MSKKNVKKQKKTMPLWAIIAVIAILGTVGAVALSNGSRMADVTRLSPRQYVEETSLLEHRLVDVRTPEEYADGHIAGAINIPLDDLGQRMNELGAEENIVVYCRTGNRSSEAAALLAEAGFQSVFDLGGIVDWQSAGYALVMR